MAWIESHQTLGHHPKTLVLATSLKCNLPTAVGHLHYLWWWTLDYAPDGIVPATAQGVVARACEWHGKPERFWDALLSAGFVEPINPPPGGVRIHDWDEYAGRLMARREAGRERARQSRANAQRASSVRAPNAQRADPRAHAYQPTNQPELGAEPRNSLTDQPPNPLVDDAAAHEAAGPDVAPPRAAAVPRQNEDEDDGSPVQVLRQGMAICGLCRLPYQGPYIEHTAAKHVVNRTPEPGNLGAHFRRRHRPGDPEPEAPPPDIKAQFDAMHEQLRQVDD